MGTSEHLLWRPHVGRGFEGARVEVGGGRDASFRSSGERCNGPAIGCQGGIRAVPL